jgi:protein phosphatase
MNYLIALKRKTINRFFNWHVLCLIISHTINLIRYQLCGVYGAERIERRKRGQPQGIAPTSCPKLSTGSSLREEIRVMNEIKISLSSLREEIRSAPFPKQQVFGKSAPLHSRNIDFREIRSAPFPKQQSKEKSIMCVEIVCRTDTGQVREHNEDCVGGDESLGIAILADGMGGYQAGEVASAMAVRTIMEELVPIIKSFSHSKPYAAAMLLEQAVQKANQVIYKMAEQEIHYRGMGTTVVAVLFHNDLMSVAHVGDSRLYRLRGNDFRQLTKDHSVMQELIDCGYYTPENARHSQNRHTITRAVGIEQKLNVEIQEDRVLYQDIYLLCSDGLSDMLNEDEMYTIVSSNINSLEQAAQLLIGAANDKGGKDNISLILVRPVAQKGWLRSGFRALFNPPPKTSMSDLRGDQYP